MLAVRPASGKLRPLLVLLPLLGCGHTEPFVAPPTGTDQPFDGAPPVQLTFNRGPDRGAAWLPDGSGIVYSSQQLGRSDKDVCFALIPATGGSQRQLTCDLTIAGTGATDAVESPAPGPDGQLAFVALGSHVGAIPPGSVAISLSAHLNPEARTLLKSLPYTLPDGRLHSGASQLRWLSPDDLLYLGERVDFRPTCDTCSTWDTLATGLDVVSLDLRSPGSTPQRIPGTENASGVSVGNNPDEIYYTLSGDSRVYRRTLSTGAVAIAHDFGAAGMARDVNVVGDRLAAVVGGRVTYGIEPSFGPMQWDSGGVLHVVNTGSGTDVVLDGPGLSRRPQISPSGSAVVVEVYPLNIIRDVEDTLPPDTLVSRRGDLYLYGLP